MQSGPIAVASKPSRPAPVKVSDVKKSNGTIKPKKPAESTSNSEDEGSDDNVDDNTSSSDVTNSSEEEVTEDRPRKRRKVNQNDDLESKYLNKLVREEEKELKEKAGTKSLAEEVDEDLDVSDSDLNSDLEDVSDSETEKPKEKDDEIPKHETMDKDAPDVEADKINRTVFLGNVSISTIKSKSAKKTLILHLRSGLDEKHGEKIESIRFRSTAFVSDAGPKRAAYAKKELMEETTKSTNAYVVVSTDAAARKLASRLNGTIVLDRHLRVDSVGEPAKVDHRRCVFVGNLSFVDEATATEEQEGERKRRAREPADVEEGLWRTFGKVGKVESVRVVRDKETRISKGFAYVQFEGENAVEAALLMNEKKFPPLLPRPMRVMRAKKDMSKKRGVPGPGRGDRGGRPAKGDTRGQARAPRRSDGGSRVVFEGYRASAASGTGEKKVKKRGAVKPTDRSSKRAAAFKAAGGKKKRDRE